MHDALIIACVLGIAVLGGYLLSIFDLPEAPPPGLTAGALPPAPGGSSLDPRPSTRGNPGNREAALLVGSGAVRRAP